MKTLIFISIILEGSLLGLIIPRTYRKNPGITLFFISDILLLLVLYYGLDYLYHVFTYLTLLFLFTFVLSLTRLATIWISPSINAASAVSGEKRKKYSSFYHDIESLFKYMSLGLLATSSILISVYMLPDVYHSIAMVAGEVVFLFCFLNIIILCKRKTISIYDRAMLYIFYIKISVLAIFLFLETSELYSVLLIQPLSSLLIVLTGYGALLRGDLFRFRIRPSADVLWKSLLLIGLIVYGVLLVYLDRYSPQEAILFHVRILLISAFIIISGALLFSRRARLSLKFFLLRHLYASRYDLLEILTQMFAVLERSNESLAYFVKGVIKYLFEKYPFSGMSFHFSAPDEDVKEAIGKADNPGASELSFTDETATAKSYITFFSKGGFDEDDRLNLRLIAELIFRITSDMYLNRRRTFKERLEVAERLKIFLIHDLKNICHTLNMLEGNISKVLPSEAEEFLDDLRSTVPHLVKRAERILNTISILKESSSPSLFSLKQVLEETLKEFHEKHIFELELAGDDRVYADREKVAIAIENILRNAHDKSFKDKGLKVRVEGERIEDRISEILGTEENIEYYSLSICDNGTPIAEEAAVRIFEPFFTTKSGGIGIGLYQAKEFIESQGGMLTLENSPSGVCFIVNLPVQKAE